MKGSESETMREARKELESVKGKRLSFLEREKRAVHLAAHILVEANRTQTAREKKRQFELARMMQDPIGKAFTMKMTDECFRSRRLARVADQMIYLLEQFGIPRYLSYFKRLQLSAFKEMGLSLSYPLVPLARWSLRRATATVILPGEGRALTKHMHARRTQGVRLNINHLGEAILGEKEARERLNVYLNDLSNGEIDYVSIKISTIFSQINLLGWQATVETLAERLRELYRAAINHPIIRLDGTRCPKFVNLDMEEYRDLELTKELFKKVLSEPEFMHYSAGIVLQAYLPDAHEIQRELTEWAIERVMQKGGAPIKIRLVKGANLAMERFEASLREWPQAPYPSKQAVDANYKRMVSYGMIPEHARAVHLGIGSHNLFDIAYAMLLRAENHVEREVSFEMLEGMSNHLYRVVQRLTEGMLLYCPVAKKEDFHSAIGYLLRRLDENTGSENFLRHLFGLTPNTPTWDDQVLLFSQACAEIDTTSIGPRKRQNRLLPVTSSENPHKFENEPDTDFSLENNRKWARQIIEKWHERSIDPIPLVIGGQEIREAQPRGTGSDPSYPYKQLYKYSMATWEEIDEALRIAKAHESSWGELPADQRSRLLLSAATKMRERRGDLIGVMTVDGAKTVIEGDTEVSEAIDFATYYSHGIQTMHACADILWKPKGTLLVAPPWNFPISIPAGGILAALATGNCVLFKPAPEALLSGWILVNALWDAGIPKEVLQFIACEDDPIGSQLICDERVNCVILTGATSTARLFLKLRPSIDLAAETGGKNALIITAMSDRDLAIKDLIQSAFGHSGQKCSAASLAILEAEIYDNAHFKRQLKDAVESLKVGSPWDLSSKIIPMIRPPNDALYRALTTLDPGEEWLVKPRRFPENPNLWSPGVKWGVKEGSFMHRVELFGPVLGVMRAKNLDHAIKCVNQTAYGLTSGLHSLDEREHKEWIEKIEAGNCYINRSITGAIVRRQPFGGTKASSFGPGAKAGGPNYLFQFCHPKQIDLPREKAALPDSVNHLAHLISQLHLSAEELGLWYASIANYSFWSQRFSIDHDPSKIIGQDNLLRYRPHRAMAFRIQRGDLPLDIFRTIAAALSCETPLEISWERENSSLPINDQWSHISPLLHFFEESGEAFIQRVKSSLFKRVRLLSTPSPELFQAAAESACYLAHAPILAQGRIELLHYLREISLSIDYHRYGNLGVREGEPREPVR
jgi:RHH-type transcriptional regulator, proline utilization regulon repressor / proline dehydrogenase / delta 1-pyrroline-5-carboxylate dehydrogenase